MDAHSSDDWPDLVDSLPGHFHHVRIRLHPVRAQETQLECRFTVRHQSRGESVVHAIFLRLTKHHIGDSRYSGRVVYDSMVHRRHLATTSLDRNRSIALFGLGARGSFARQKFKLWIARKSHFGWDSVMFFFSLAASIS